MTEKELKTRLASKLWSKMYRSNFFSARQESQKKTGRCTIRSVKGGEVNWLML